MMNLHTDKSGLQIQYADSSNLNARVRLHQEYSTNPGDFVEWLFDQVEVFPEASVLEVGCGPGWLWRQNCSRVPSSWRIIVSDFSPGMVGEARSALSHLQIRAGSCVSDAQYLPFPDESFDIVFANHMLYHVPDLHLALAEFRRILRPEGVLYTATNGRDHLREIDDLLEAIRPGTSWRAHTRGSFRLDDADVDLARHFRYVRKLEYEDTLQVPEPQPLIEYIQSSIELSEDFRRELVAAIQERIDQAGFFFIRKDPGLLIAKGAVA